MSPVRIAAAAYPIERLAGVGALGAKLAAWVASADADLLVFPEYAGSEVAILDDQPGTTTADVVGRAPGRAREYRAILADLAAKHRCHILSGSLPDAGPDGPVNRAWFVTPEGREVAVDKCIPTPWEEAHTPLVAGAAPVAIDCALGRIGVLICHDAEFPLLGRALAEAGAEVILVPSATDGIAGATRVAWAARARALEAQAYVATAPLLGGIAGSDLLDANTGWAGVYAPPDPAFWATGVLAEGARDAQGWVRADLPLDRLAAARAAAEVRVPADWPRQILTARVEIPAEMP